MIKKFYTTLCIAFVFNTNQAFGAEEGMPQLNPEYWSAQIFWLTLIFITLYIIIWKIFMPKIMVNGVGLYYEETGTGTPLLFLHEFAGDYASWEPQMRFFGRRYRAITMSYRGYLPSDIPEDESLYSQDILLDDVIGLMDALEIETKISAPVFKTEDALEGPRAFMEKRKPIYKGR